MLERITTSGSDNGWKFGGTATCSCYNQIIQVLAFDRSRGGWLDKPANQNQIFGGAVRADNNTGIGLNRISRHNDQQGLRLAAA